MASTATLELYIVAKDDASKSLKTIGGNVEKLGKQTDQLAKLDLGKFESGLSHTADTLGKLALPMVGVGVAAGKMAMDFDTSLRNINSIAGLSESSLTDLGQSFIDLSLDSSKTLEGASALADGFYDIQSSGFAGADGMKVLEAATKASSAGMTQTAVASKALTGALNAYGLGADQAGRVSDVMFQTVNAGVITFDQLAGSIGNVLPTAAAANVSIEQVGAAIASMTKSGIAGSVAVTDLNSLINSVIKPTKEASDAAKTFGFDLSLAALQSKGLNGFLADMVQKTGGGAENISKLITSQEGLAAALSLTKGDLKGFNADLAGMEASAGAADRAFQEMSKAASSQIKIAKKDIEAAAISIGSVLLPKVVDVTKAVADMAESFAKLPKDEREKYTNIALGVGKLVVGMYALTKATQGAIVAGTTLKAIYGGLATVFGATLTPLTLFATAAGAGTLAGKELEQANLDAGIGFEKVIENANKASPAMQRMATATAGVTDEMARQNPKIAEAQAQLTELTKQRTALLVTLEHAPTSTDPLGLSSIIDPAADAKRRTALANLEKQIGAVSASLASLTKTTAPPLAAINNTGSAFQTAAEAATPFAHAVEVAATSVQRLGTYAEPTEEQIKKLNDELTKAQTGGLESFSTLIDSVATSYDQLAQTTSEHEDALAKLVADKGKAKTDAERTAIDDRIAAENTGYANELAAQIVAQGEQLATQKQHLGEMLIAQIETMAQMGTRSTEEAAALVAGIRTEYGVLPDLAATSFGSMQASINDWASDASISAATVIGQLHETGATADSTRVLMEQMAKKYEAELIENFKEGKIDADELKAAVAGIPARIESILNTNWASELAQIRAIGGAMAALPDSKLIRINAGIDPMLQRRSPSPIEQVMANIEAFAARNHIFHIGTMISGDLASDSGSFIGPLKQQIGGTHIGPANTGGSHIGPLKQELDGIKFAEGMANSILLGMPDVLAAMRTSKDSLMEEIAGFVDIGQFGPMNKMMADAINAFIAGMTKNLEPALTGFQKIGDRLGVGVGAINDASAGMSIVGPKLANDFVQLGERLGVGASLVTDAANKMSIAGPKFGQGIAPAGAGKLGQGTGATGSNKLGVGTGATNDQPDPMETFAPRAAESGKQAGTGAGMGFGDGWRQGIEQIAPVIQDTTRATFMQLHESVLMPWQNDTREFFGGAGFGFIGAASVGIMSAAGGLAQVAGNAGGAAGSSLVSSLSAAAGGVGTVVGSINDALSHIERNITITITTRHVEETVP